MKGFPRLRLTARRRQIEEMDLWGLDALDLVGPASIEFGLDFSENATDYISAARSARRPSYMIARSRPVCSSSAREWQIA